MKSFHVRLVGGGLFMLVTLVFRYIILCQRNLAVMPSHQPESGAAFCNISTLGITGPVYLFSFVTASSPSLIKHFLQHYVQQGVPPENMTFVLQADSREEQLLASEVFGQYDVKSITNVEQYTSNIKRDAVNRHILSLPNDAWLIYPDLDEFFHFPCPPLIKDKWRHGLECVGGSLLDRLSPFDLPIPYVNPDKSITSQFPLCAKTRAGVMGFIMGGPIFGDGYKTLLFPLQHTSERNGRRYAAELLSSHRLGYRDMDNHRRFFETRCNTNTGAIDHYSWTADQVALAAKKQHIYQHDYGRRIVYDKMLSLVSKDNRTGLWSFTEEAAEVLNRAKKVCPGAGSDKPMDF